jgi:hypothetical protein
MLLRYRLMLITVIGALACLYFGGEEYVLSARSSKEPEEISVRDLIRRGPDGNPNIILKDYSIFEDYVYKKKMISGRWTKVWVPIVPKDDDETNTDEKAAIHVFLYSEDVANEGEARQRFSKPRLRGLISQQAPKPGIINSILIEKRYPGTQTHNCIIIVEGKEPAGVVKLGLFAFGIVAFTGLTGGIWYIARQVDKDEAEKKLAEKKKPAGKNKKGDAEPDSIFIE